MTDIAIHFSEYFDLDPKVLKDYGAFDVALTFDVPVFIDPFRLYASDKKDYNELHERIIRYLRFLRDCCREKNYISKGFSKEFLQFPEVRHIYMGFCRTSNSGRGLGKKFADALQTNLQSILRDFGNERISHTSHLEKLCVICDGVGRDCISDFTANLIKDYLAKFTEAFARRYLKPEQCGTFDISHAVFDFEKGIWKSQRFYLPKWKRDYVLLVPTDLLTKDDTWINKDDLLKSIVHLPDAVDNAVLKDRLVEMLDRVLNEPIPLSKKEVNDRFKTFCRLNPEIVDWYIKRQEDNKAIAMEQSDAKVAEAERLYVDQVNVFAKKLAALGFYKTADDSVEEARKRALYLKQCIENNDVYKLFFSGENKKLKEEQIQLAFRLVWYGTDKDVNRETNNGRGPVDYKVSKGCHDQCLVEFKLASSKSLEPNLKNQIKVYQAANNTQNCICVIVYTNEKEFLRMEEILQRLELLDNPNVITIDASPNKISASKVGVSSHG